MSEGGEAREPTERDFLEGLRYEDKFPSEGREAPLVCSCGWYSTRGDSEAARRHIVQSPGGVHNIEREAEDHEPPNPIERLADPNTDAALDGWPQDEVFDV